MDLYEKLLNSSDLYPPVITQRFGKDSVHWEGSTPRERELSLRHDYVAVLLTNTQLMGETSAMGLAMTLVGDYQTSSSSSISLPSKRAKVDMDSLREKVHNFEGKLGGDEKEHSECSDSEGEMFMEDEEEVEWEGPGLPSLKPKKYRYQLIEGVVNEALFQTMSVRDWGWDLIPNKVFDILDNREKTLVEVKVSLRDPEELCQEVADGLNIEFNQWSMVVLNPDSGEVTYLNMGPMPGEDMALDFLTRRRLKIQELGIQDDQEFDTSETGFFTHPSLTVELGQWLFRMAVNDEAPIGLREADEREEIVPVDIKDLLKGLDDLSGRELLEPALYKGRVFPEGTCVNFETHEDKDWKMVQDFMEDFEEDGALSCHNWDLERAFKMIEAVKQFKEVISENPSNYNYFRVKKKKKNGIYAVIGKEEGYCSHLLEVLGVGAKKRVYTEDSTGMKQPDYPPQLPRRFDDWVTPLITELIKETGYHVFKDLSASEVHSDHPIDKLAVRVCNEIISLFQDTGCGMTCQKSMNLLSRIGGSYLINITGIRGTTHSSVAGMPIYSVARKDGKVVRLVSGILIRGPHHVKDSTDKINFVTVEKVDQASSLLKYAKCAIVTGKRGCWALRQNTYLKADAPHGAFLSNLLFVPANFAGEILLTNPFAIKGESVMEVLIRSSITDCREYHLRRMTEVLLMGMLGNSQEEGYFSSLRMMFMMVLAWSRREVVKVIDVKGMCDAMNECLTSSAYSMWTHKKFLELLTFINVNGFTVK